MGILEIGLTIWAWNRGWKAWALIPMTVGITLVIFIAFVLHNVGAFSIHAPSFAGFITIEITMVSVLTVMVIRPKRKSPISSVTERITYPSDCSTNKMSCDTKLDSSETNTIGVLILPDRSKIILDHAISPIGRGNFQGSQSPSLLHFISRQHFWIRSENEKYYIEDYRSANGTKLNGIEIRGKGLHALHDGDHIDIAGIAVVTFRVIYEV